MRWKYEALRLAALASFAFAGTAMAQTQTPQTGQATPVAPPTGSPDQEVTPAPAAATGRKAAEEEILVTGSRVRRKDLTTPAPVTVISREQINASAVSTIGEFLQMQPENGGALNTNVNNGGDGQTRINLRDLGEQRTLVLVDGKRMVNGGVGVGTAVDLNSIPTAAVERIEILKDGASAVYGSDAIAGVVNIITRKRLDGVEVGGYAGVSQHNDANVYDLHVLAGSQGSRGSFMFGAGYFNQRSFFAGARDWAQNALKYTFNTGVQDFSGSPTTPKVRVNALDPSTCRNGTAANSPLCEGLFQAFGGGAKNFIFDPTRSKPGATYVQGWRIRDSVVDFYNYQSVNYLLTPSERISLFGNGDYRLADFARAYLQASYVQRGSNYLVAPEPFSTSRAGVVVDATQPFNPFRTPLLAVQRRLTDLPGRGGAFDVATYRLVGGIDGTVGDYAGPLSGWFWDAFFNYGRAYGTQTNTGFLNTVLTGPGLGPGFTDPVTGVKRCGTLAKPNDNCTPVDLFGAPGSITPEMAAQLGNYTGTNTGLTQLFMFGVSLSGELFSLPAADRPAQLAVGYEHRNEFGFFEYNPILAGGFDSDTGAPGPANTRGGFYVNEGYGELVVPVVSNMPFAENVEVQAAVRGFNYNTFGSDWTYKFGARWTPIRDVTIRGTYSNAFRAPNILELFQGLAAGNFEPSNDPCSSSGPGSGPSATPLGIRCANAPGSAGGPNAANNGIDVAQVNSANGGTPTLQPEKARIGTIGAVFTPTAVRGLTLTSDFWRISMTNLIGNFGTQLILNKCYGAGNVPQDTSFCSVVTRDPTTGELLRVTDANINQGKLLVTGVDLGAQYALPTDYGRFVFRFNGTYLVKFDYTDPSGQVIAGAGNYDGFGTVSAAGEKNFNPKVKFNAGLNYSLAGLSAGFVAHFIGPLTECSPDGGVVAGSSTGPGFCYQNSRDTRTNIPFARHEVSAQWTFDALASYRLRSPVGATTLAFGVRNLTNQRPPRLYDSFLTYADPSYDFVGRYFYGRVEHKF